MKNGDFLKKNPLKAQPGPHVIKDLIRSGTTVMLASPPGEGKSLVALAMLYHIAYGAPFLGYQVEPGNVLFIDSEHGSWDILTKRIQKVRRGLEMDGHKQIGDIDWQYMSDFRLDEPGTKFDNMCLEIAKIKPRIIVLDHLRKFHSKNEEHSKQMNEVSQALHELRNICGSTVMPIHHFNKGDLKGNFQQRLRGSTAIYADADAAFEVRALHHREVKNVGVILDTIGLIPQPKRDIVPLPIRIKIDEGDDYIKFIHDGTYEPVEDAMLDMLMHDTYHVFTTDKKPMTVNEVRSILAGRASERETRDMLHKLESKRHLLHKKRLLHGKYQYTLVGGKQCPWCGKP